MILESEIDHGANIKEARDNLRAVLKQKFQRRASEDAAEIMAAFDAVLVAERALNKREWRDDFYRSRAHDATVAAARETAKANRRAARIIRDGPRTCTRCSRSEPEVDFYHDQVNKNGTVKRRPLCKPCELKSGADYRARKKAEADTAAELASAAGARRRAMRAV
jgi:hypothetical protein